MKRRYVKNFLRGDIVKEFSKYGFGFLYIGGDLDTLYAVTKVQFPLDDVPYIEFTGVELNEYRDVVEFVHIKEIVKNKAKEIRSYKCGSENKWIYESPVDDEE